ncbi:MAG: DUF3035 domain-containing protein [Hyphomonadaceae bacterium]
MNKTVFFLTAAAGALTLAACGTTSERSGTPNEFRIIKKAPLTVPPEYSLRPPAVGTTTPAELASERADRRLNFGDQIGASASESERVLVAKAGAISVSPIIRETIDYEEAGILRKNTRIGDAVTGWTASEEELAEAESDSATGGDAVTIERSTGTRIKLPGT